MTDIVIICHTAEWRVYGKSSPDSKCLKVAGYRHSGNAAEGPEGGAPAVKRSALLLRCGGGRQVVLAFDCYRNRTIIVPGHFIGPFALNAFELSGATGVRPRTN